MKKFFFITLFQFVCSNVFLRMQPITAVRDSK